MPINFMFRSRTNDLFCSIHGYCKCARINPFVSNNERALQYGIRFSCDESSCFEATFQNFKNLWIMAKMKLEQIIFDFEDNENPCSDGNYSVWYTAHFPRQVSIDARSGEYILQRNRSCFTSIMSKYVALEPRLVLAMDQPNFQT